MRRLFVLPIALLFGLIAVTSGQAQTPEPEITNSLTIIVEGRGSVNVSYEFLNPAKGVPDICDQDSSPCEYPLAPGPYEITLTATADEGWAFTGFSGAPATPTKNANSITFIKTTVGDLAVTANFEPLTPMPLKNWAIYIGIGLIVVFLVIRFRKLF